MQVVVYILSSITITITCCLSFDEGTKRRISAMTLAMAGCKLYMRITCHMATF
jgi:hypothetical protein